MPLPSPSLYVNSPQIMKLLHPKGVIRYKEHDVVELHVKVSQVSIFIVSAVVTEMFVCRLMPRC